MNFISVFRALHKLLRSVFHWHFSTHACFRYCKQWRRRQHSSSSSSNSSSMSSSKSSTSSIISSSSSGGSSKSSNSTGATRSSSSISSSSSSSSNDSLSSNNSNNNGAYFLHSNSLVIKQTTIQMFPTVIWSSLVVFNTFWLRNIIRYLEMCCDYWRVCSNGVFNAALMGNCIIEKLVFFKILSALLQCLSVLFSKMS
jgi:hypothetical protein